MRFLRSLAIILLIMCVLASCNILPWEDEVTLPATYDASNGTGNSGVSTSTSKKEEVNFDPDADIISKPAEDPYKDVDKAKFYANYTPAENYWDAYYRSIHFLMSGSIEEQDQKPTVAQNQPKEDGLYIRNTSELYSSDDFIISIFFMVFYPIFR